MTDETVEAVARVIELAIVRHGVEEAALEGTLDDAVSAITVYEANRTEPDDAMKVLSYDHAHEDAVEMGYPSLTEALEHLSELREANRTDVEELRETLAKFGGHKAACRLNVRMGEPCTCGWGQALTRISSLEKKGTDDGV